MKLQRLQVEGFGRFAARDFRFGPGLNVVAGPNEAGKSTLAAALVASLYGLSRAQKERWRPWTGDAFATVLDYETSDGARWEVQREFERDSKGIRVYDAHGADAATRIGDGRGLSPGEAHLQIPLEVFVQTACVRQRSVALESASADAVAGALARALSGGPQDDAAIGALDRLEKAIRTHVGTQRAHKNAPLRTLREREERESRQADAARGALSALAALREKIERERSGHLRDAGRVTELSRRARALRAAHLRARLDGLKEYHDEVAALQLTRATFDDVAAFSADRVAAFEDAYHSWRSAESVSDAASRDASEERLTGAERDELAARRADAGTFDDDAFGALRAAAAQAEAARARSVAAAGEAAAALRSGEGGRTSTGALAFAAALATVGDAGIALAHAWQWASVASVVAIVLVGATLVRSRARALHRRAAAAAQSRADAALAEERLAADVVQHVLEPLGIRTPDELIRRRERLTALAARDLAAHRTQARARTANDAADAEAARFDLLAAALVPDVRGTREERRLAAQRRAARRRERDGLDARLAMLALVRGDLLHGDDDFALQAEYDALIAAGTEAAAHDDPQTLRTIENERSALDARARDAERRIALLEGELRAGEENLPDLAALDESLAATRSEIARLEAFARAIELAFATVAREKDAAHRGFARRLAEYSADVLATLTAGRYGEIHLDPATLAIRVRVPETGRIEDLDRLSAGTRDQIALVVRLATSRMFAEGLERPPLLLDDPFAFWDADRVARCLPVLLHGAREAQIVVFTASSELATAALARGATGIALQPAPAAV